MPRRAARGSSRGVGRQREGTSLTRAFAVVPAGGLVWVTSVGSGHSGVSSCLILGPGQ